MKYHTIEIDEEVWGLLQKKAKPFVDSPNTVLRTVLRRELLGKENYQVINKNLNIPFTSFFQVPYKIPAALEQTLRMIYLVKHGGFSRNDATNNIAKELRIRQQSVIDKYCRQLNKKAYEVDRLLSQNNFSELKSILIKKFTNFSNDIDDFFRKLK